MLDIRIPHSAWLSTLDPRLLTFIAVRLFENTSIIKQRAPSCSGKNKRRLDSLERQKGCNNLFAAISTQHGHSKSENKCSATGFASPPAESHSSPISTFNGTLISGMSFGTLRPEDPVAMRLTLIHAVKRTHYGVDVRSFVRVFTGHHQAIRYA